MNTNQPTLNEQPLIQTFEAVIGNLKQLSVNARDLHSFLEVGKVFAAWIQERISKYEFIENEDFIAIFQNRKIGHGRGKVDYHITLDMAKELSMVENNAKGREARRYFIAMEKKALGLQTQSIIKPIAASKEQLKSIEYLVHRVSVKFAHKDSASQQLFNRLRVDLNLRNFNDIQELQANIAIQILENLDRIGESYQTWRTQLDIEAINLIIRDGRPWTPTVAGKLRKKLDLEISQHPDWNKLAIFVNNLNKIKE